MPMKLALPRRIVRSEEASPPTAMAGLRLARLAGNSLGRRTAGMYMGRRWRVWCALGEAGVEAGCSWPGLLLPLPLPVLSEVLSGDICGPDGSW